MRSNFLFKLEIEKLYLESNKFTLIGVDLGKKFTGISVSDYNLKKAYILTHYQNQKVQSIYNQALYDSILQNCKKNNSKGIVIGQPTSKEMGNYCVQFAERLAILSKAQNLIITTVNEDCTTMGARYIAQKAFNQGNSKELIDQLASMLILQSFLDTLKLPLKK